MNRACDDMRGPSVCCTLTLSASLEWNLPFSPRRVCVHGAGRDSKLRVDGLSFVRSSGRDGGQFVTVVTVVVPSTKH